MSHISEAFDEMVLPQLSVELLRSLTTREGLSEQELVLLSYALSEKSLDEIVKLIGAPNNNAYQKRLGQVFTKMRIEGRGPGKLEKLRNLLFSRLQAEPTRKKITILSRSEDKDLSNHLKNSILGLPQFETNVKIIDAEAGINWLAREWDELKTSIYNIICVRSDSIDSYWLHLVAGFLAGKTDKFKIVYMGNYSVPKTLMPLSPIEGTNLESVATMLREIDSSIPSGWIEFQVESLKKFVEVKCGNARETLSESLPSSEEFIKGLIQNTFADTSLLLKEIIHNQFGLFKEELLKAKKKEFYCLPAERYPYILVALQEKFKQKLIVKAVAVLEDREDYWSDPLAQKISETASAENERLFVFINQEEFNNRIRTLALHAKKYKVRYVEKTLYEAKVQEWIVDELMKREDEEQLIAIKNKDLSMLEDKNFSIIEISGTEVKVTILAKYGYACNKDGRKEKCIEFHFSSERVKNYTGLWNQAWGVASEFKKDEAEEFLKVTENEREKIIKAHPLVSKRDVPLHRSV